MSNKFDFKYIFFFFESQEKIEFFFCLFLEIKRKKLLKDYHQMLFLSYHGLFFS